MVQLWKLIQYMFYSYYAILEGRQASISVLAKKLDGVGPVDNRPSTD